VEHKTESQDIVLEEHQNELTITGQGEEERRASHSSPVEIHSEWGYPG
jgi:hypothetical protein